MPDQTDADIPETGAIFTFGKSSSADNVPSLFWLKNDHPVEICSGKEHSAIITENGRLLMFGGNTADQLGLKKKPAANRPASVKALRSEKVRLVACGRDHTLVCTSQHSHYGVGRNQEGQLGLGHKMNTKSFQLLQPFCEPAVVKMLAAGSGTSAALTEEGRLFMWGDNSVGQIGLGDELCAAEPRELNVGQAVISVSCGNRHSAFVTVHGELFTFGESANGRLGLQVEQLAHHRVPQQVQGIMGGVIQVCCGGEHTLALTGEDVYTFGRGQYGQLGHGTFEFELHLPKPLEHFHNSSAKRIACGENHSAVITKDGLLYTFGDGRYGKLGLQEENFINQFSPTLCIRFLKYCVQSVSCGGHHTLVFAVPRSAARSQDVEPQKDAAITDFFWESEDPEHLVKDSLMDPAPVVPLSALAARARHRERKSFVELFGKLPKNPPHPNSGFLSTSWHTTRNIHNLKLLLKDVPTPKAATANPLLSPRSQSVSSRSAGLSSKQSSHLCQSKASTSRSKSKKLPSSMSSSTSIANRNSSTPACIKKAVNSVACGSAKNGDALNDKLTDALSPEKPCRPNRPLIHVSDNNLDEEGPQTEGEAPKGQLLSKDVEDEGNHVDILPYMETKTGTDQITKEPDLHEEQDSSQSSHNDIKKEFLTGSISRQKKIRVTSREHQNIDINITKPPEGEVAQHNFYKLKSRKPDKRSATHQPVQKEKTKVNEKDEKDLVTDHSFKKELKRTPKRQKISSALEDIGPPFMVTNYKETSRFISTENVSQDDAAIQNKSGYLKSAEMKKQQDTNRLRSTPTKKKVERNIKSTAVHVKSQRPKFPQITKPPQAESLSVKSTPVKGIKPKTEKNRSKHTEKTPAGGRSIEKSNIDALILDKTTTRTSEKQKLLQIKKKEEEITVKQRNKTKRVKEGDLESEDNSKTKRRIKTTEASSPLSSNHEDASEASNFAVSSQSPKRTRRLSVSGAKSFQSSEPAAAETFTPEMERKGDEDLHGGKQTWEILSNAASLLPAAGIAGAAVSLLGEVVTHMESFQADSDRSASTEPKTPIKAKQLKQQSVIMHPSFSSTVLHSDSEERDDSTQKNAQMSMLSDLGNAAHEEEFYNPSEPEAAERIRDEEHFENEGVGEEGSSVEEDSKMVDTNPGDEEHEEDDEKLGSDVESKNKNDEEESSVGMDAAEESEPGEEDEEQDSESGEEESEGKTSSDIQEEEEESNKSDTIDAESEEEESSTDTGKGVSHSEGSETAEEDEGGSEEQSDDEGKGDEDSEESGDEEEKNSEGSESEEEEDRDVSDTEVSEEEETEEPGQSDEEEEMGREESGGEDSEEEEEEEEEEGELSTNEEEAEEEAAEDEEEGQEEEESTEEENEEEQRSTGNQEDEATEEESKSEEEDKSMDGDEENEEGEEESKSASEEESEDDYEEEEASEDKGEESEEEEGLDEEEGEGEEGDEEEEDGKQERDEHEEEEEGEEEKQKEEEEEDQREEDEEGEETEEEIVHKTEEKKGNKKQIEKSRRAKGTEPQVLASAASPSGKGREAPRPAPRSKPRAAEQKKPEESQQFWNDVLPQYLDLQ